MPHMSISSNQHKVRNIGNQLHMIDQHLHQLRGAQGDLRNREGRTLLRTLHKLQSIELYYFVILLFNLFLYYIIDLRLIQGQTNKIKKKIRSQIISLVD